MLTKIITINLLLATSTVYSATEINFGETSGFGLNQSTIQIKEALKNQFLNCLSQKMIFF